MSKEVGYYLDGNSLDKVKKARALDVSLLGRVPTGDSRKRSDEAHERIFGKEKKKMTCKECVQKVTNTVTLIENGKTITRCLKCNDKKKSNDK